MLFAHAGAYRARKWSVTQHYVVEVTIMDGELYINVPLITNTYERNTPLYICIFKTTRLLAPKARAVLGCPRRPPCIKYAVR